MFVMLYKFYQRQYFFSVKLISYVKSKFKDLRICFVASIFKSLFCSYIELFCSVFPMDLLPDEVLLMIFEFLPVNDTTAICKKVCKRWAKLVERRSLIIETHADVRQLHSGLRSLLVLGWLASLRSVLLSVAYYAPYLRSLTVHAGMPFTNEHLADLKNLPNIEHLDVFARSQVHDAHFTPVVKRLKSIVFNESIAPELFRDLSGNCQLSQFHMYGRAIYYHRRYLRVLLQLRGEYLHDVTLRCTELTDAAYETIGNCANLKSLRLYSCWLITRKGIIHVTKPPLLRCLHVTGARLIRSQALGVFLKDLPMSVGELVLSASCFGDEHAPILVKKNLFLHTLELWKCKLSTAAAVTLALSLPYLKCFDIDLKLSLNQINELQIHPNLEFLRCLVEETDCNNLNETEPLKKYNHYSVPRKKIKTISSDARFPRKYFRSGSEGFRGSLFYFWTQSIELVPLPAGVRPSLDDEEDMFY